MTKSRFCEIRSLITKAEEKKLKTAIDNKEIRTDNAEKIVEDITSGRINESEAKELYNIIVDEANAIVTAPRLTRTTEEMVGIFRQLKEIFAKPKADDKADDKADEDEEDYEIANEQPDTTYMPELESEESAELRRKKKGQGIRILTPQQCLVDYQFL